MKTTDVETTSDPMRFGAAVRGLLEADPVVSTVVATMVARRIGELTDGWSDPRGDDLWFAVREGNRVVGAGMYTGGVDSPYLLGMPDEAARTIAVELDRSGRDVLGVNGDQRAATAFGDTWAQLRGVTSRVGRTTRLFEVERVRPPVGVRGALRPAGPDDLDLVLTWSMDFHCEAHGQLVEQRPLVERRIGQGLAWLWCTDRPVSYVGTSVPSGGVQRIAPVYTPPEQRRHGYAGAAVAAVAQMLRDDGLRVCLFTDTANATANHVYSDVGFVPLGDSVSLRFD